jgi:hypothetical protein
VLAQVHILLAKTFALLLLFYFVVLVLKMNRSVCLIIKFRKAAAKLEQTFKQKHAKITD